MLLQIEDAYRTKIIDWRWETPNAYQFTAQVVVEIAKRLGGGPGSAAWMADARSHLPAEQR